MPLRRRAAAALSERGTLHAEHKDHQACPCMDSRMACSDDCKQQHSLGTTPAWVAWGLLSAQFLVKPLQSGLHAVQAAFDAALERQLGGASRMLCVQLRVKSKPATLYAALQT